MLFLVRGTYEYVDGRGSRWRGYREASSNVYDHIPAKVVASRSQKPGCQAAAGICEHISTCRLISHSSGLDGIVLKRLIILRNHKQPA